MILAIDPGTTESALVEWNGVKAIALGILPNDEAISVCKSTLAEKVIIEKIASYGMAVGAETFETVFWSGRFAQAFGFERVERITRGDVKMHLCHSMRAKDGNIRQALIDRFGDPGRKKTPGMLYGFSGDLWAALAVAVTWWDKNRGGGQ